MRQWLEGRTCAPYVLATTMLGQRWVTSVPARDELWVGAGDRRWGLLEERRRKNGRGNGLGKPGLQSVPAGQVAIHVT